MQTPDYPPAFQLEALVVLLPILAFTIYLFEVLL